MRKMIKATAVVAIFLVGQGCTEISAQQDHHAENATCTGSASCRACKNCKYCKHCNSGGSCGVCKR